MSHNSDGDKKAVQSELQFQLSGSQRKTAFALRRNIDAMIAGDAPRHLTVAEDKEGKLTNQWIATAPRNLNSTAFLTLTVGDESADGFKQVWDSKEASRRINNLNRRVLPLLFERAVIVTERHKNGAIHFHVVGVLRGKPDIRTGFDFAALENAIAARNRGRINKAAEIRYKISASEKLRNLWQMLRETLPDYGFGRAELTPIKKTGEAIACYVSKYIEKNLFCRLPEDRRKKLVRYLGDWTTVSIATDETTGERTERTKGSGEIYKIRPNDFGWCSKRATAWRCKARQAAALIDVATPEQAKTALGPRWAWHLTWIWKRQGDDLETFIAWKEGEEDAAEMRLNQSTSVEWQLSRLWKHRFTDWDLSDAERQKNELLVQSIPAHRTYFRKRELEKITLN